MNFEILFDEDSSMQPLSFLSIRCHDLCKLMHFGSAPIKVLASFCLVELFDGVSDDTSRKVVELKFGEGYLLSLSSVLEGLILFDDIRVALNCSQCLSSLMTWKLLRIESMFSEDNWCRLIVEELVMSLCTSTLTSSSFRIHQKPALIVAVALLQLSKLPSWVAKVFTSSSIQRIIENISPSNVDIELVILFRELLDSGHLNSAHVSQLSRVFQVMEKMHLFDDHMILL